MADLPPCVPLGVQASFGFGDRIGLATPGHIVAMERAGKGVAPIFPQQSIREMTRTGRNPSGVMADALNAAHHAGYRGPIGADADHLKTTDDIDATVAAGFTFFTLDPSGFVDPAADQYDEPTLRVRFAAIEPELGWMAAYRGQTIRLDSGTTITIDEEAWLRAGVKYGLALNHACGLARHLEAVHTQLSRDYEVELSVDETDQPTTLAEHWLIADRCLSEGMKLVSLAPRFVGDFEKGIDYKGDLARLQASLRDHAAIAASIGPYKLSLHSGSDKLSMYPLLAAATQGRWHVKTAGTSYLEALRVVAAVDEHLFRAIVEFARVHYDRDKATYHVSATLQGSPPADQASSAELVRAYLGNWSEVPEGAGFTTPGRQILHCTFGSTLTDPTLGPAIRGTLDRHQDQYTAVLADHFARHLRALRAV